MPRSPLSRALVVAALGLAAALGTSACGSSGGTAQHAAADRLSPADFGERASRPGAVLLDVRTPEEFAAGHLAGAVNVDVEAADFAERIAELDKDVAYSVYCRSGNRSQVATGAMTDAGFTDVADLAGGITAWAQAGGEVVTD